MHFRAVRKVNYPAFAFEAKLDFFCRGPLG